MIKENPSGLEVRICENVHDLDELVREKAMLGLNARLMAGFCWPWSKSNPDGTLVDDVVAGTSDARGTLARRQHGWQKIFPPPRCGRFAPRDWNRWVASISILHRVSNSTTAA